MKKSLVLIINMVIKIIVKETFFNKVITKSYLYIILDRNSNNNG
jgi:hypothetical protein